jgi:2-iminobutanoate/2-iminopropanoate deaminase
MPHRAVASEAAPRAIGPYSQAILREQAGTRTLPGAGQIALDPATGERVAGDARAQTERVLQNVAGVLAAAGMGFADVVKTTVFLVDLADFAAMNEVYGRRFQGTFPARSTVQVAALPRGSRVEIEVLAVQDAPPRKASARRAAKASPRSRQRRR